jgi:hypothetical protein
LIMQEPQHVDVRASDSAHLSGLLLAYLRELLPGQSLQIVSRENPEWALRSADLYLQHRLDWRCQRAVDGSWTTTVRCLIGDDAATDLVGLLLRDHRRLDAFLARALGAFNAADFPAARASFSGVAHALKAHLAFEDDVLAPQILVHSALSAQATEAMHAEHTEILMHLSAVEHALAEQGGDLGEAAILCGMLSGVMAKHEHREETSLFPLWQAALARLTEDARTRLLGEARERLGAPIPG